MITVLFNEIYGCYYLCIEKMLELAVEQQLTQEKMLSIIHQYAFEESHLQIIPAIQEEKWQLIDSSLSTPLKHHPSLPLTTLEKRWLKAISLDSKFKLFSLEFPDIQEEPLFTQDDFKIYDQYLDGDPYDDITYQKHFHLLLKAIHEKRMVYISYLNREIRCLPYQIEYSLKDDKFRLLTLNNRFYKTLNISKITSVELLDVYQKDIHPLKRQFKNNFIIEFNDQRNTLDRVMTHFADMQKQAEQLDNGLYRVKIYYEKADETELLIRVLSFGPYIKVVEPKSFVNLIKERLMMQRSCGLR